MQMLARKIKCDRVTNLTKNQTSTVERSYSVSLVHHVLVLTISNTNETQQKPLCNELAHPSTRDKQLSTPSQCSTYVSAEDAGALVPPAHLHAPQLWPPQRRQEAHLQRWIHALLLSLT